MSMGSFRDLIVWQKAIELSKATYKMTALFPREEMFGLTSQMRRAAVSVASNIAEGKKRGTRKDLTAFLRIAEGSAAELETQTIIAEAFYRVDGYEKIKALNTEIQKMLNSMTMNLRQQEKSAKM